MNARDALDAARARIAELEAERDKWHGDAVAQMRLRVEAEAERDRLQEALRLKYGDVLAERDRLKAALKPFAEWSRKLDVEFGDHEDDVIAGGISGGLSITFGDLRRARRALSDPSGE